jgi:stress response protein YsnF
MTIPSPEPTSKSFDKQRENPQENLANLRKKLQNFVVVNEQGHNLGQVRDVRLNPDRTVYLVIAQPRGTGEQLAALSVRLVEKINAHLRQVLIQGSALDPLAEPRQNDGLNQTLPLSARNGETDSTASSQAIQPEQVREETIIPLLEERLKLDYKRRKVGEVIIRKKIEKRIVEVPVYYERLIVEQVSPERKQLADVKLSEGAIPDIELLAAQPGSPIVNGEFTSPLAARQALDTIAESLDRRCRRIRIEIELADESLKDTYQAWLNNHAQEKKEQE